MIMKNYMRFIPVLLGAFLLSAVAAMPTQAQTAPATSIAVVDMSVIISKAKAYVQLREQMDKLTQELQADAKNMEEEFTKQREDLVRQKTLLSPDSFKQRQEKFQSKFMAEAKGFDTRKTNLRATFDKAVGQIQQKLAEIASNVAQARGFNIVITGDSVLYAVRGFDVSEDVLKQLDEALPKVNLAK